MFFQSLVGSLIHERPMVVEGVKCHCDQAGWLTLERSPSCWVAFCEGEKGHSTGFLSFFRPVSFVLGCSLWFNRGF